MKHRTGLAALMTTSVVALWASGAAFSSATFTASSTSTGTVRAAADWTPPTVALQPTAGSVKGTVTLTATAADGETGVKTVTMQYYTSAAGWVDICTTSTSPYTCAWDTTKVGDGSYSLRAVATDNAGYSTASASTSVVVANNLVVSLADPGEVVRGTAVSLTTTLYGTGSTTYTVDIDYAPAGTSTWSKLTSCQKMSSPYLCVWDTTKLANGSYDLRATATANGAAAGSSTVFGVLVDNAAPTTSLTDPGSPLSGTVTLSATASDADSGISTVDLQYATAATGPWTTACTASAPPYSCAVDTTKLARGSYYLRSLATDLAGNQAASATVGPRTVDNTVASVTMNDPGAYLVGTVALSATANSNAGITSVTIQRAPGGSSTWTDVCTVTAAPYQCSWSSTTVPDGSYDFRAVLVDGSGRTTTSVPVTGRQVDNVALRGYDVQTSNGGTTAGKVENGDTLTLTYTDQVDPASVLAGWTGASQAVTLRLTDGASKGATSSTDILDLLSGTTAVNVGSVNTKADLVKASKNPTTFNATMTAGTVTVNGAAATTITIRVGAVVANGGNLKATTTMAAMVWTPSGLAKGINGAAASTAPTTELGTVDRDF